MRRLGLRILMVSVGVSLLVFYALSAGVAYWLLTVFRANRPPLGRQPTPQGVQMPTDHLVTGPLRSWDALTSRFGRPTGHSSRSR